MVNTRRLFVFALLVIAPALAACNSITHDDDPPPPPAPTDSIGFKDNKPWG